jgi:hypothetical protein
VHALRLYGFMLKFAYRMGNPSTIVSLEQHYAESAKLTTDPSGRDAASTRTRAYLLENYVFGFANNIDLPMSIRHSFSTEEQLIETARARFLSIRCSNMEDKEDVYYYHRQLDETMFTLAMEWKYAHMLQLTPSHCCVCLLMNSAPSYAPVQILDLEMVEGRNYLIFSAGNSYDPASRTIAPCGGVAIIFAFGHPPTLNDAPTVKLQLKTTAFTAVLSSRTGEPNCLTHNGFTAGYLEKARSDFWSKSVINITLQK